MTSARPPLNPPPTTASAKPAASRPCACASTVADLDGLFDVEPVGEMEVKGRAAPVAVYRLVGLA